MKPETAGSWFCMVVGGLFGVIAVLLYEGLTAPAKHVPAPPAAMLDKGQTVFQGFDIPRCPRDSTHPVLFRDMRADDRAGLGFGFLDCDDCGRTWAATWGYSTVADLHLLEGGR